MIARRLTVGLPYSRGGSSN